MTLTFRRISGALLTAAVTLGAVVATPAPARADEPRDTCPFISVADSSKAARAVFAGQVTDSTEEAKPAGETGSSYVQEVEVTRVYRGTVDTETTQVRTERVPKSGCNLGQLDVGTDYMFFVVSSGDPWVAESGKGTAPLTAELTDKVVRLLGEGHSPVAPPRPSAEFTPVDVSEPTELSRAVAPGLAMMLVGVLGLVVVRGLGRRR